MELESNLLCLGYVLKTFYNKSQNAERAMKRDTSFLHFNSLSIHEIFYFALYNFILHEFASHEKPNKT